MSLTGLQLGGAAMLLLVALYLWRARSVAGTVQSGLSTIATMAMAVMVVIGVLGVLGYLSLDVMALVSDVASGAGMAWEAVISDVVDRAREAVA
jgi:hypothetical protein